MSIKNISIYFLLKRNVLGCCIGACDSQYIQNKVNEHRTYSVSKVPSELLGLHTEIWYDEICASLGTWPI